MIRMLAWLAALALLCGLPLPAEAAEEGGGLGSMLWHAVNLVLLVAVLVRFGREPVRSFFAERRHRIETELDGARRGLEQAQQRLERWNQRLAELDREVAEVRERVRSQAEAEAQRIREQAQGAAERIRRDAAAAVEQESIRAREELRREAAILAVEVAGSLLQQHIGDADRTRLVEEFVEHIEAGPRDASAAAGS